MEGNLYEILGIKADATSEQIRKAYRKKALETHPDRLPPDASEEDKTVSADKFRAVNNAYEVLNDPNNRILYDQHGSWPPPGADGEGLHRRTSDSRRRHDSSGHPHHNPGPFGTPIFTFFDGRHPHPPFAFTDPFMLFNSIFGDMPRDTHFPFPPMPPHRHEMLGFSADSRRRYDEFDISAQDLFNNPLRRHTHSHGSVIPPMSNTFYQSQSTSVGISRGGRWTEETYITASTNGVSQSTWKRRDLDGNVHVTKKYSDGREKYTINGVDQSTPEQQQFLPNSRHFSGQTHALASRSHPGANYTRSQQPPPPYTDNGAPRPGPHSAMGHDEYSRSRDRIVPDSTRRYVDNLYPEGNRYHDQKRRWWRR